MRDSKGKRLAAINDLAGFGRSSLANIISVVSAMGIQCCPVPTAVLSSHLALPGGTLKDLTDLLSPCFEQWKALGIKFDAIYSGFLGSEMQVQAVQQAFDTLLKPEGIKFVDPVMGDDGKLYRSITPSLCGAMRALVRRADLITPNLTEAAALLGEDFSRLPLGEKEIISYAKRLQELGPKRVVITGLLNRSNQVGVACLENGRVDFLYQQRFGGYYPGTGDLFASVLAGKLLGGAGLAESADCAAGFICSAIKRTLEAGTPPLYGVEFEPLLGGLAPIPAS